MISITEQTANEEHISVLAIQDLLRHVSILSERDKAVKAEAFCRGNMFNVFLLCGVDYYENRHSAIIAGLLDPSGSHGQRDRFLRYFLQKTVSSFADEFCSEKAMVITEYSTSEGRLDILIQDNNGRAVIVENKIYAADQESQLKRYESFARKKYGDKGYRLLYLTLDGCEASDQSGNGVDYITISYEDTILAWLEACLKTVYDKPFLRESIIQYINLLKQMTGRDMDKEIEKELVEEMLRFSDGVVAIYKAFPAWERAIIEKKLFEPLSKFAESRGLKFDVDNRFWTKNTWGSFSFEVEPNLSLVFQYEKRGRYDFYYGITDQRPNRGEIKPLPGFEGGNDNWRYGWHYFEMHRNWAIDDILEIGQDGGAFLQYICKVIDDMLTEMKYNKII